MTIESSAAARAAWSALGGDVKALASLQFAKAGTLPSCFAVADIAAAAIAVAALALDEWAYPDTLRPIQVDRRLSALWFRASLRPLGWKMQAGWDVFSSDYATRDGWIRLHTNASHHRAAARSVLGNPVDREATARAVATWRKQDLEDAVIAANGCAAAMHDRATWDSHAQGIAVASAPLIAWQRGSQASRAPIVVDPKRPLAGIRVLDLTRVIAGPVASRFLAGYGAKVLRIDPQGWDDQGLTAELSPGKHCATLDLKSAAGRATFRELLATTDVLLHGYRADALERLGIDANTREKIRPGLIDVALNAYGWSGPWRNRRGFDSLVQMSTGIADAGMHWQRSQKPVPLPVQALDHATGYLLAASVLRGLCARRAEGIGGMARLSLARTAQWLSETRNANEQEIFADIDDDDFDAAVEATAWGPAQRLKPPAIIEGIRQHWDFAARPLGSAQPRWL